MQQKILTVLLLLAISFGFISCGRHGVPAEGAEKRFDNGLQKDKNNLTIYPKNTMQNPGKNQN